MRGLFEPSYVETCPAGRSRSPWTLWSLRRALDYISATATRYEGFHWNSLYCLTTSTWALKAHRSEGGASFSSEGVWYWRNMPGISKRLSFRGFEAGDLWYGLLPAKQAASFFFFFPFPDRCLQRAFITNSLFTPEFSHLILAIVSSSSRQTCRFQRKCPSVVPPLPLNELPQQSRVPRFFSHNAARSHPELSTLRSPPPQGNKSSEMLSEAEGRSIPGWMRHLLTLTPSLSMSHNKGSWRMGHKPWMGHSQPVTDHLRMYYNLLVTHDQKTGPLNLFGLASR